MHEPFPKPYISPKQSVNSLSRIKTTAANNHRTFNENSNNDQKKFFFA